MGKSKIRSVSPRKEAERAAAAEMRDIVAVGVVIGLPDIQRRSGFQVTETNIDGSKRTTASTLIRLTKAQMLRRSTAIDKAQLAAIERYVALAEAAYADRVKSSSWGDGGGSSPTAAAAGKHAALLHRLDEADHYWRARAALPGHLVAAFERVVLDNHHLGDVGEALRPGASERHRQTIVRDLVQVCADKLCAEFRIERTDMREHLAQTMDRFHEHCKAAARPVPRPMGDALTAALAGVQPSDVLHVSPDVMRDVMRETGATEPLETWDGHEIVVVEHWLFGWLVQVAPVEEQRAA